jgi:hypothetical protein
MLINLYSHYKLIRKPLIKSYQPLMLFNSNNTNTLFNPLPGSTLGVPLNILQYVFTTAYYGETIINSELVILQFCLGFFTYGLDRLFDAYEYYNNGEREKINDQKKALYSYLVTYDNYFISCIFVSYLYIYSILSNYEDGFTFLLLLMSTLFYKKLKTGFGQFKALYIGMFWSISCVIMPCVLHDHNFNILYDYSSYAPCFFTLFASSNLLDIKDIQEDRDNKINTLPVIFGEKKSIVISYIATFLSMSIFLYNPHFKDNILPNLLFEFQNLGSFIIPTSYNLTIT